MTQPQKARDWDRLWDGTRTVERSWLHELPEDELIAERSRLEQAGIEDGWIESKGLDKAGIERFRRGRMIDGKRIREYVTPEEIEVIEPQINRRRIIEQINQIQRSRPRGVSRRGGKSRKSETP
jgi:hypothetical protein